MHFLICVVVFLAVSFGFQEQAQPAVKDVPQISWQEGKLEEILDQAKKEKKLVFIILNMDGEAANERLAELAYHDRNLVRDTRSFLCVAASKDRHQMTLTTIGEGKEKQKKRICDRFGGAISCEDHQDVEKAVLKNILGSPEVIVSPQHIVLSPDGEILMKAEYEISVKQIREMLREAWLKQKELNRAAKRNAKKSG